MKALWVMVAMMTLVASGASALDINDKWGIGAAVFNGGGEVSLIRGKSERSAWLLDVTLVGTDTHLNLEPPQPIPAEDRNANSFLVTAGPGYRRFTRPTEDFSPYWDVALRGSYGRDHQGGGGGTRETKSAGVATDFSLGLEYFTKWHFSVAAHTSLIRFAGPTRRPNSTATTFI
jgi:hypothetical protein